MKQYYFVYKTVCKANGKIYIGAHKTKNINNGIRNMLVIENNIPDGYTKGIKENE
jgi:hypothetical protein